MVIYYVLIIIRVKNGSLIKCIFFCILHIERQPCILFFQEYSIPLMVAARLQFNVKVNPIKKLT